MSRNPKALLWSLIAIGTVLTLIAHAQTLVVTVDRLSVRTGPGRTYAVVETIQKNELFAILDEQHGWYQISIEGTLGWVSGKAVRVDEKVRGGAAAEIPKPSALQLYSRTWAVVIGINQYANMGRGNQLEYAVSDAKAVETLLREELGFNHVKSLYNQDATKNDILATLNTYLADAGKEDAVFVFFAGHGHTEPTLYGDVGYILPHDGSFDPVAMYRNIAMTELSDVSKRIQAKHVFYVMDSCYSGQLLSRYRAGAMQPDTQVDYNRLRSLTSRRVRQVLTAGGKGETVLDGGPFGHSVFTGRLIEALRGNADVNGDGFITAPELELYVGDKVFADARQRGKQQNPQFGNLFAGEGRFVFRTKLADSKLARHRVKNVESVTKGKERAGVTEAEAKPAVPRKQEKEARRPEDARPRFVEPVPQLSRGDIRQAQKRLQAAGLNPGPADGILGARTVAALRQYQTRQSLPATGELNPATLESLAEQEQVREETRVAVGVYPRPPLVQTTWPKTLRNTIGMEFVLIPAGSFMMGSTDRDAYNDEQPVHKVTITQPFYLGKYEVTQAQWADLMGDNPSDQKGDLNRPVEQVSWDDVQEFIQKLNAKAGGTKYRLPTEAEWEYAVRAGTEGTRYHTDVDAIAWYSKNSNQRTHAVGQKLPNAWGLYDMLGNVEEWVQDWYGSDYYEQSSTRNPQGSTKSASRVIRGGGWLDGARGCRAAFRYGGAPGFRAYDLGFRLARSVALGS